MKKTGNKVIIGILIFIAILVTSTICLSQNNYMDLSKSDSSWVSDTTDLATKIDWSDSLGAIDSTRYMTMGNLIADSFIAFGTKFYMDSSEYADTLRYDTIDYFIDSLFKYE